MAAFAGFFSISISLIRIKAVKIEYLANILGFYSKKTGAMIVEPVFYTLVKMCFKTVLISLAGSHQGKWLNSFRR